MSKAWRCPECDTINQDKKCVVCGYENPDYNKNSDTKQIPDSQQPTEQKAYVQDSLNEQNESGIIVSKPKSKILGKVIAAVSSAAVVFGVVVLANVVQNINEESDISIPTLTIDSEDDLYDGTDESTLISITTLAEEETDPTANSITDSITPVVTTVSRREQTEITTTTPVPATTAALVTTTTIGSVTTAAVDSTTPAVLETEFAKIPDYHGLSAENYTAELKRLGLPYQVLMCPAEDVLEGYVVSITGGNVGEYYDGIHAITVYEAFHLENDMDSITIRGKEYSTSLISMCLSAEDDGKPITNNDIKDLGNMKNLKELVLYGTNADDFSAIEGLTNLEVLEICGDVPLSYDFEDHLKLDVSFLSELNNLKELTIVSYNIDDTSFLLNKTKLEKLQLQCCRIKDVSFIKNLKNLKELMLEDNCISDISTLGDLNNLEYLYLNNFWQDDNKISDITIIKNFKKLKMLWLNGNPVSEDDVEKLKELLPNCEIHY